jgi:hypothetical protein
MVELKRFSSKEVQAYRERVEEFSNPEARHCYSCQKYVPDIYKDNSNYLVCTCGSRTCHRCRKAAGSCDCCSNCHLPLSDCKCCARCKRHEKACRCATMNTNSTAVQNEVKRAFPNAKKCPQCPHAWEKTEGCNHCEFQS